MFTMKLSYILDSLFKSIINSQMSPEMHNVGIILLMHYHPIAQNMRFHKERDEERKLEGRGVERRGEEKNLPP